jgi:16S rRNA (uracil1498-N3)-methyltransferase
MDCIFWDGLNSGSQEIIIIGETYRHVKALHLRIGEPILITNGLGLTLEANLVDYDKTQARLIVKNELLNHNENWYHTALGIGILDNKDRFEFAIEKAIELGVNEIIPLVTQYSQKTNVRSERLKQKAISALIQSKRSMLPIISDPIRINDLSLINTGFDTIILFDQEGKSLSEINLGKNILILIGPEGGFSDEELRKILVQDNANRITLGSRRLRAETAAITALSLINHFKNIS